MRQKSYHCRWFPLSCASSMLAVMASLVAVPREAHALSVIDVTTETLMLAQTVDALTFLTLLGTDLTSRVNNDFSVTPGGFSYADPGGQSYNGSAVTMSGLGSYDPLTGAYAWLTSASAGAASWTTEGGGNWSGDDTGKDGNGEVVTEMPDGNKLTVTYKVKILEGLGGTRSTGSYDVTLSGLPGKTFTYSGFDVLDGATGKWRHYLYIPELDPKEPTLFLIAEGHNLSTNWPEAGGQGRASFAVAPVPLPGALPLMIGALGLIGLRFQARQTVRLS